MQISEKIKKQGPSTRRDIYELFAYISYLDSYSNNSYMKKLSEIPEPNLGKEEVMKNGR